MTSARRRIDLLAQEAAHGRISRAAFDVGRRLQLALESVERIGGSHWGDRVGGSRHPEAGLVHHVEAARRAAWAVVTVERIVGLMDACIVVAILGENLSFAQAASRTGRTGRRATSAVATRFRDALERIALAQKAIGAVPSKIEDKHSIASETIFARKRMRRAA